MAVSLPSLPSPSRGLSSVSVSLIRVLVTAFRAPRMISFENLNVMAAAKTLYPNKVRFTGSGD